MTKQAVRGDARGDGGGTWLVLAAALLWGTTGTAQALAPFGTHPLAVGAVRLLVGAVALNVFALARKRWESPRGWPGGALILAALGIASYQLCFFAAVSRTGVAVGTVVGIGSSPVIAGILAFLARGERPGWRWLVSTLLAVAGCTLLMSSRGDLRADPLGIVLAVVAGGSYALSTMAGKVLVEKRSPDAVMAVVFSVGALLLLPVLFVVDLSWLAEPRGAAVALHLGVVATAVAYGLFARGLARIGAPAAVTLSLAEPLTAAGLGVAVLEERLGPAGFGGIVLILAGLLTLAAGVGRGDPGLVPIPETERELLTGGASGR